MCPEPSKWEQRATRSRPYIRSASSRCSSELWGPGEPGRSSVSPPSSGLGAINSPLPWGAEGLPLSDSSQSGLVLQGEELVWTPGGELSSGFAIHLGVSLSGEEGDTWMGALEVDRMEDCPVVEMEGNLAVVDAKFECRD